MLERFFVQPAVLTRLQHGPLGSSLAPLVLCHVETIG
jgi:hypothetical protein